MTDVSKTKWLLRLVLLLSSLGMSCSMFFLGYSIYLFSQHTPDMVIKTLMTLSILLWIPIFALTRIYDSMLVHHANAIKADPDQYDQFMKDYPNKFFKNIGKVGVMAAIIIVGMIITYSLWPAILSPVFLYVMLEGTIDDRTHSLLVE